MRLTAPVRIDLSAGWPDSDPYRAEFGGHVLNTAIELEVSELRYSSVFNSSYFPAKSKCWAELEKDLVVSPGKIPDHSGLGTSGCLRALELAVSNPPLLNDKIDLIKKVHFFENKICGNRAGFQDQAAAVFGGTNLWYFSREGEIQRTSISMPQISNLVLTYIAKHNSGDMHSAVFSNYNSNIPRLKRMSEIAVEMASHPENLPELIRETWELQKQLHHSIETDEMRKLQEAGKGLFSACRALGAGGGGCMIFYCEDNKQELESALSRHATILHFKQDDKGIQQD